MRIFLALVIAWIAFLELRHPTTVQGYVEHTQIRKAYLALCAQGKETGARCEMAREANEIIHGNHLR